NALGELTVVLDTLSNDLPTAANVVKAFSTYFQLVNLAEEHQRVRILRTRENRAFVDGEPMDETIANAVATLKREGVSATEIQNILSRLFVSPVFTAHPTESRRKTIRQILKHVSYFLEQFESDGSLDFEKEKWIEQLKSYVVLLWQSDETRNRRPTVMDEVRNTGLYFFEETLFDIVPKIYEELEVALSREFPTDDFEVPSFLRYGSWIGGDRDGNPLVTNAVTEEVLSTHKDVALTRYEKDVLELYELLSVSKNWANFDLEFLKELEHEIIQTDNSGIIERFELEPYRQKLILMYRKLWRTRKNNLNNETSERPIYQNANQLLEDLRSIRESLNLNQGEDLAKGKLNRLIRRVEIFGFHLATLDVRQHSGVHRAAIAEIFQEYGIHECYQELDEADKIELLQKLISSKRPLTSRRGFSDGTNNLVTTFRLIQNAQETIGPESMQTYIISMTKSVSHLLEVLLLMKDSSLFGKLDLVPLFETVDDLLHSPDTMTAMFNNPIYQEHLRLRGQHQQIMIGYSDSNKDGGYLQANWMLFKSQRKLAETCKRHGVALTLFHGRGGSLGRGGGPANRAILAQPTESVNGRIRVTEQGEVVSSRYSNPAIARRHLQQLLHAVICSTGSRPSYAKLGRWETVMNEISDIAYRKYRDLVEHPSFIDYFQSATPIELIEKLNIGSRPSRRKASRSIDDLRAIPWVFSWTQSRANLSSWFGIGSSLMQWIESNEAGESELQEMYQTWPFFKTLFQNVHLGLGRADMSIAGLYAEMATGDSGAIFQLIESEYQQTCEIVLKVTGDEKILDTEKWLQHSINVRNPYVDPLNYIQVALLKQFRQAQDNNSEQDERIRILSNSVNGIAAGLQNVG
ncbi:MAG: phosphoenolpyruvate carboxylase, partial [Planctomycetota bacterium]